MLTHVVLFKLKEATPQVIAETVATLRGLEGNVPSLRALEVGEDILRTERSYDVGLIARFDSLEGLEAYQLHPAHQEVLAYMRGVTERAVAVDFEG